MPRDGSSYYEKICLRGEISKCRDRAWSFERVPDRMLQGHDDEEFSNVPTRRDCEELCLRERSFQCRSAEYDTVALTCTLSRETRRTKPKAFRTARNVDYLENGCIDTSECCRKNADRGQWQSERMWAQIAKQSVTQFRPRHTYRIPSFGTSLQLNLEPAFLQP